MRDDLESEDLDQPEHPATVKIAGILWIIFGGLLLLAGVGYSVVEVVQNYGSRGDPLYPALMTVSIGCGAAIPGLIGAAFVLVGIRSVRGKARGTLGNSIGSIVLGGSLCWLSAAFVMGWGGGWMNILVFACGSGLLTAGVLGLIGRGKYKAWYQMRHPPARRRRSARRDEEQDEEDQPRRQAKDEGFQAERPRRRAQDEDED
jgi:hypothetical protein